MSKLTGRLLVVLAFAGWVGSANAYLLTFENRVIDRLDLAGAQTEGDFSYLAVGSAWEVVSFSGNPPSALATFGSGPVPEGTPVVGDYVDIFLSEGGLFRFDSVEFATALSGPRNNSDDVTILGLIGDAQVDALNLFDSSTQYLTVDSGWTQPVDRLRVQIAGSWMSNGMFLDNFNLTPTIPAPATIALFAIALAGLAWIRRY